MRRGSRALVITLVVPVAPVGNMDVLGLPQFGWFKELKNSPRKIRLYRSVNLKFFANEKSRLTSPGPTITPFPVFPKTLVPGCVNAARLNQESIVLAPSTGTSATRFAH